MAISKFQNPVLIGAMLMAILQIVGSQGRANEFCASALSPKSQQLVEIAEDPLTARLISDSKINKRFFDGKIRTDRGDGNTGPIKAFLDDYNLKGVSLEARSRLIKAYNRFKELSADNPFVDRDSLAKAIVRDFLTVRGMTGALNREKTEFISPQELASALFAARPFTGLDRDGGNVVSIQDQFSDNNPASSISSNKDGIVINQKMDGRVVLPAPHDGFTTSLRISASGMIIVGVNRRIYNPSDAEFKIVPTLAIIDQRGKISYVGAPSSDLTNSLRFFPSGGLVISEKVTLRKKGGDNPLHLLRLNFFSHDGERRTSTFYGLTSPRAAGDFYVIQGAAVTVEGDYYLRFESSYTINVFNSEGEHLGKKPAWYSSDELKVKLEPISGTKGFLSIESAHYEANGRRADKEARITYRTEGKQIYPVD